MSAWHNVCSLLIQGAHFYVVADRTDVRFEGLVCGIWETDVLIQTSFSPGHLSKADLHEPTHILVKVAVHVCVVVDSKLLRQKSLGDAHVGEGQFVGW